MNFLVENGGSMGFVDPNNVVQWTWVLNSDSSLSLYNLSTQIANFTKSGLVVVGGVPVISTGLDLVNTTAIQTITATAAILAIYSVSLFMKAIGNGGSGHTLTANLTYTTPDDAVMQTITLILHLDAANIVIETYPLLCKAGTPITITTAYGGGAVNDPYTLSFRLVQMPA